MQDTQIAALIAAEQERQRTSIELIPSENYVSQDDTYGTRERIYE